MVTNTELLAGLRTSTDYAERVTGSFLATLTFLREQGGESENFADEVGPRLLEEYDAYRKQYDNLEGRISAEGTNGEFKTVTCETPGFTHDRFVILSKFFIKCSRLIQNGPEYAKLRSELAPEVLQIIMSYLK